MDYKTKLAIAKQSMVELKPFLFKQSVAFFTHEGRESVSLASGTLVSIGSRLFIATAAHTVADGPNDEVWVLNKGPRSPTTSQAPVLKKGKYPKNDPDVGFLELGTTAETEHLKGEACPLGRIAVQGIGRPLRAIMLIGNPGEYVKREDYANSAGNDQARSSLIPLMIGYYTIPLMESEWPNAPDPDPNSDIFLDYPDTPAEQMEGGESLMLPNPKGMSGGGVWDQGFEDGVLWTKEAAKLIGIQSRWNKNLRYVRAVQIIHWLRLIHENYPDVRLILERSFSVLRPVS
jgi:hypothetical protein